MGIQHLKGQVGIEFLVFIGVATFIAILIITATIFYLKEFRGDESYDELKAVGDKIRNEVYMAASVEDGYQRAFYLREDINYSITKSNKTVLITTPLKTHAVPVEVEFTGNFQKGWNNITRNNGVIDVN